MGFSGLKDQHGKARGGFVIQDADGQTYVGQGNFQNGKFMKEETGRLAVRPTKEIESEMIERGLWGSYLFFSNINEDELVK